jgi:hypothetical protein
MGGFIVLIGIALMMTIPLWLLWNWLMPIIFGLPEVTFFQAFGLSLLSSLLFKSTNKEFKL